MIRIQWGKLGGRIAVGDLACVARRLEALGEHLIQGTATAKEARAMAARMRKEARGECVDLPAVPSKRDALVGWTEAAIQAVSLQLPKVPGEAELIRAIWDPTDDLTREQWARLTVEGQRELFHTHAEDHVRAVCRCSAAAAQGVDTMPVVDALVHRLKAYDPQLKARTTRSFQQRLADAVDADAARTSEDTPDDPHLSPLAAKLALSVLDQARNELGHAIQVAEEPGSQDGFPQRVAISLATAKALHQALTHVAVRIHG